MAATNQLSRDAYERLRAELEDLTTRGRVDIARKIEVARELGDLSENGDYHAAKDAQGQMEARIRQLEATLESAEIVERTGGDEVATGTVVTIRYQGDDATERYLVGSIEERHSDLEVISPGSPLGRAVMGAKPGDTVEYEAPGGVLQVEVVSIEG
jgi:transcription elongation factor GreA